MFLQIHFLTSYPASLLNRDDAGLAKRIPFGNATRIRISSQCQKRHWRERLVADLSDMDDGFRTRSFFNRVVQPKIAQHGVTDEMAKQLSDILANHMVKGGIKDNGDLKQAVLFGVRESDYFAKMAMEAMRTENPTQTLTERLKSKEEKANLAAMSKSAAGMTAALFGRMVTSDLLARVDAPIHVAHAFTVHAAQTEMDFFTVVDDLNHENETGSAHANQSELGAGLYYGYVVVDIPLLVSNLTGCKRQDWRESDFETARRVLEALVHAIATQSPGAKKGSTAPYAYADLIALEVGTEQPRTLANAFLDGRPAMTRHENPLSHAVHQLFEWAGKIDEMYGINTMIRGLTTTVETTSATFGKPISIQKNIEQAMNAIWRT